MRGFGRRAERRIAKPDGRVFGGTFSNATDCIVQQAVQECRGRVCGKCNGPEVSIYFIVIKPCRLQLGALPGREIADLAIRKPSLSEQLDIWCHA